VRSSRFGAWTLLIFALLVVAPAIGGPTLVWWVPLLACCATTLGALGYGVVGLTLPDQRGRAVLGLLAAAVPLGAIGLLFWWASQPLTFD
jgi:hypothetical protein